MATSGFLKSNKSVFKKIDPVITKPNATFQKGAPLMI